MVKYDFYVSGGMAGLPNQNKDNFNRVVKWLEDRDFTVFNPANIEMNPDSDWSDYVRAAIQGQMSCDAMFMLNDYEESKRAMIEYKLAKELDMDIVHESDMIYNVKSYDMTKC